MKRVNLSGCIAASVLMTGCSFSLEPETNQEACVRAMTHFVICIDETAEDPEATEALEALLATACEGVPEEPECDWPAMADCVTMLSCEELMAPDSSANESCSEVISDFAVNECSASSFGALKAIER